MVPTHNEGGSLNLRAQGLHAPWPPSSRWRPLRCETRGRWRWSSDQALACQKVEVSGSSKGSGFKGSGYRGGRSLLEKGSSSSSELLLPAAEDESGFKRGPGLIGAWGSGSISSTYHCSVVPLCVGLRRLRSFGIVLQNPAKPQATFPPPPPQPSSLDLAYSQTSNLQHGRHSKAQPRKRPTLKSRKQP